MRGVEINPHRYPTRTHARALPSITLCYRCDDHGSEGRQEGTGGEAGGRKKEEEMKALRSLIREPRQILCLNTLVFNIEREYITRSVVLATPEMLFELAQAASRRLVAHVGADEGEGEVANRGKLQQ